MTRMATGEQTKFNMISWQIKTPDGTMHVHVQENDGKPVGIMLNIGKAGSAISAWADATSRLVTLAFDMGAGVNEIISELSGMSGEKAVKNHTTGVSIRSGPDGIAYALMQYRNHKFEEHAALMQGKPRLMVVDNGGRLGD